MSRPISLPLHLLAAATIAGAGVGVSPISPNAAGYRPMATADRADTLRGRAELVARHRRSALAVGAVVPGYLSARGLPPVPGRITVTDTGLVFQSYQGSATTFPLVGPVRKTEGRQWRPSTVSLAYMDETNGRPTYIFRIDAGVFETELPGALLEVAAHPIWLDSLAPTEWTADRAMVDAADSTAIWTAARHIAASAYADSLYALFGQPRAAIGLIGRRGRTAGRLGEYIGGRDSLALDPGRMTSEIQLRHTLAHELGHRWQAHAPTQVVMLWSGVPPIRDPKRYGHGNVAEHQAEAIAFAVNFLQTTAGQTGQAISSLRLLDHYELLVPGTRTMVRYLALQPLYRYHPLRSILTTGEN